MISNHLHFSYDTVDQIVLNKNLHRYKGHSLIVKKIRVPNGRCKLNDVIGC